MQLALYLPTYRSAAEYLEHRNSGGTHLVGWTLARSVVIAAPLMLFGVPARKAIPASLVTSALMSAAVVLWIRSHKTPEPLP